MPSFFLNKDEKIVKEADLVGYIGVTYKTQGNFGGIGIGPLFGGSISVKQTKIENSASNMKYSHAFLTNQRLVFCRIERFLWLGNETKIGNPISEIPLDKIAGMTPTTKMFMPAISLAIRNENQLDNVVLEFSNAAFGKRHPNREVERNEWIDAVQKMKS